MDIKEVTPEQVVAMYRPLVEDAAQAGPMLLVKWADDPGPNLIAIVSEMPMQVTLAMIADEALREGRRAEWALLTTEAWVRTYDPEEPDAPVQRSEAVSAVLVTPDSGWTSLTPFERVLSGVEWGETTVTPTAEGGAPDVLRRLFA